MTVIDFLLRLAFQNLFVLVDSSHPICLILLNISSRSFPNSNSSFHCSASSARVLSLWAVDVLAPCQKLRCIPKEHVQLLFHYIAFILGFVKVALHLFDQVLASSSSALLFRSSPSKSLIIPLSLSSFSSVTAISTIFYNSASLLALSLQLLFHVFDYAFTAFSTAFISAENSLC